LLTDGYYNYKMDIWGVGCVFFEVLSLFPLFPGNNEKDQIHKIHNILGTPPRELLDRLQKYTTHIEFNFPHTTGTGIAQLIPHVSVECQELIGKLLIYNPDERMTAKQALNSNYFKDLRTEDTAANQPSIHKEPAAVSPRSGEDHENDLQDKLHHQASKKLPKQLEAPTDFAPKRKNQQGNKKTLEQLGESAAEYEEPQPNNVTLLF
jgi:serine/threonine protein kinase